MTRFFEPLSRIVYGVIAIILLLLALVLAGDAVFQFFREALVGGEVTEAALGGIGYLVVAIATFEIARYLTEEKWFEGAKSSLRPKQGAVSRGSSPRLRSQSSLRRLSSSFTLARRTCLNSSIRRSC